MTRAPARHFCCSFCGDDLSVVDGLMFVGTLGGLPPAICSGCIERYALLVALYEADPAAAAAAIMANNGRFAHRGRVH